MTSLRMLVLRLVLLVLLALVALPAFPAELGDPAPPLKIVKWIKGGPVDLAARVGQGPTVVDFWATWNGQCKKTIPHLTELQKKYQEKGVVFVGISKESPAVVEPFVAQMGAQMEYAVAVDDQQGTDAAYMKAFKQESIPHAFIVGPKGDILWHGHPAAGGLEPALDRILAGTYDVEQGRKAIRATEAMRGYFQRLVQGRDDEETRAIGAGIVADGASDPALMNEFAWTVLTEPQVKTRDLDLAMKAAQAALDGSQSKDAAIMDTYARALFDTGRVAEAIEHQKKAVELATDEALRKELEAALKTYEEKAKADAGAGEGGK